MEVFYFTFNCLLTDLFDRAIMMSGTMFSPWANGGAFKDVVRYTAKLFSCPDPGNGARQGDSEAFLRCLQNVDAKNLTSTLMDHMVSKGEAAAAYVYSKLHSV